jgi:sulfur-carrier protein adenylyltransferase/sulfurtransferase
MIPEISPTDLKAELEGPNPPVILDVRESYELEISSLPNAVHIPMNELPGRLTELDSQANIVVICRVGGRSRNVTAFLVGQGFKSVRNMATGMNGWADTVDPSMSKY